MKARAVFFVGVLPGAGSEWEFEERYLGMLASTRLTRQRITGE